MGRPLLVVALYLMDGFRIGTQLLSSFDLVVWLVFRHFVEGQVHFAAFTAFQLLLKFGFISCHCDDSSSHTLLCVVDSLDESSLTSLGFLWRFDNHLPFDHAFVHLEALVLREALPLRETLHRYLEEFIPNGQ